MSADQSCGLHPAPGAEFCGPTAIAAIVGVAPADVVAAVLKHRETNKPPKRSKVRAGQVVTTMWSNEIAPVLAAFGWRVATESFCVSPFNVRTRMTFAQWQSFRDNHGPAIVLVTGHFVAVSGHWFVDTHKRSPIPLALAPWRSKRVQRTFYLEPIPTT
jgi:hypothetical protein